MASGFEKLPAHLKAAVELGFPSSKLMQRGTQHSESIDFGGNEYHLPKNTFVALHGPAHAQGFHGVISFYDAQQQLHEIRVFPDGRVRMPKKGSAELNIDVLTTVTRVHKAMEKNSPKD